MQLNKKIKLFYKREDNESSVRMIWPLGLFFWGKVWTMVAWCEMRNDYRQFRIDRIEQLKVKHDGFITDEKQTLKHYLLQACENDKKKM